MVNDQRYMNEQSKFLEYAYLAVGSHFDSQDNFMAYFNGIKSVELKKLFLRTASFYLFLVKRGDWVVDIPGSDRIVDYLTNTYQYVAIFSLIESLSEQKFIDFFEFLIGSKSCIPFPIQNKTELEGHYRKYKNEFGSIQRCISFFRALDKKRQADLISRLQVQDSEPSIENLAKYLYEMRSKFVHEAELVLHMTKGISIGHIGKKRVVCKLSIQDAMLFFEEGLIIYFGPVKT